MMSHVVKTYTILPKTDAGLGAARIELAPPTDEAFTDAIQSMKGEGSVSWQTRPFMVTRAASESPPNVAITLASVDTLHSTLKEVRHRGYRPSRRSQSSCA